MSFLKNITLALLLALASCNTAYRASGVQYDYVRITPELPKDSALIRLTQSYRDSLHRSMSEVLGIADAPMERTQPSGSLNDFITDAILYMAKEKMDPRVSIGVMNYSGVRLYNIPAGPITRGTVFELMPFDNQLLVQGVKGSVLQQFLDATAKERGWPLAGVTMQIKEGKAVNVRIAGQPINPEQTYYMAITDFVVNVDPVGAVLRQLPVQNTGYLVRDAIMDYVRGLKAAGKTIRVSNEKRITNAQ
jgi:2',3'-cyclic-nucleotide 2'-phosphodiesterase (5'-nucleotidase family)